MPTKRKNGFTLVELLFVLTLTLLLMTLALAFGNKGIKHQDIDHFFNQLVSDSLVLQQLAIDESRKVDIIFYPNKHRYELRYRESQKVIYYRTMPNSMNIDVKSTIFKIGFNEKGNASFVGKIIFQYIEGKKEVYVYLGSGRVYIP